MRRTSLGLIALVVVALVFCPGRNAAARQSDAAVMLQFERAADSYVFAQRQDERRGVLPAQVAEGRFFDPLVAAAFRARIRALGPGCNTPGHGEGSFVVPPVNAPAAGTADVPPCVAAALPRLPSELQYRAAGVTLLLIDAHRNAVIDILHAAFP